MLIDWFTVFAQLVNFLILMGLLKLFLYKPITQALKDRENKIAGQLADADHIKADAERERNDYIDKNESFERQREAFLQQARDEAQHERDRLIEAARGEAEALRAAWLQSLKNEQNGLHQDIMRQTREEVFAMTRKTLGDLASVSLEQRLVEVFIERLQAMNAADRQRLVQAMLASTQPIGVHSAFELDTQQCSALEHAIREVLGIDVAIDFQTVPEIIGGIELSTDGHKLAWTVADYLASLEHSISQTLAHKTEAAGGSGEDYATG